MRDGLGLADGVQRVDNVGGARGEESEDSLPGGAISVTRKRESALESCDRRATKATR